MRLAIIGCGEAVMRGHLPSLRDHRDIEVVAVCDVTAEQRAAAGDALGLDPRHRYADHRSLLDGAPADLALVATPHHVRGEVVVDLVDAGLHVLCEKPLGVTMAETDDLLARCPADALSVCHNYAFLEEFRIAADLVAAGAVGEVRTVVLQGLGANPWAGAAAYRPGWRDDLATSGGGRYIDTGIHAVYLMELMFGEPAESVSAVLVPDPGTRVDAQCFAHYRFPSGVGSVAIGRGHGAAGASVVGTEGRVHLDYAPEVGDLSRPPHHVRVVVGDEVRESIPVRRRTMFPPDFYDAVLRRAAGAGAGSTAGSAGGRLDGAAGRRAIELVLATYQAGLQGGAVRLPLAPADPVYARGLAGLTEGG